MKTRILVSAISLAIALVALPAAAELRIEGDPLAQGASSEVSGISGVSRSNYHEVRFDDGLSKAPAGAIEQSRALASNLVIVPAQGQPAPIKSAESSSLIIEEGSKGAAKPASESKPEPQLASSAPAKASELVIENASKPAVAISTPVSSSVSNPSVFSDYITQSGLPSHPLAKVAGGTDVLLTDALRQVIPSDFRLVDNEVPLRKLATWTGNRSWVDVLADLGRAANFVSHINWQTREVSLAPAPSALANRDVSEYKPIPAQVSQVRESREIQVVDKAPVAAPAVEVARPVVVAPKPVIPTWSLDSKLTLRENVEEWARKAGWTLVWDAVDYPIFAPASFQGDFASSTGPLAQLFAGYSASDQPLLVRLTSKDRVVYVRNRVLERAEITGLPQPIPEGSF